jgi:release factor glutamine methyltransferase
VLCAAVRRLQEAGVPEPEASAEILLSELTGLRRGELYAGEFDLSRRQLERYAEWIAARERREPVQRILGYAYFRNLRLQLNEETLVPRPETESVVEAVLERVDRRGGSCRVLDLGTGSGAIAVSVAQERPRCRVYATDVSEAALRIARLNAAAAGVEVEFRRADLAAGLEDLVNGVDLLVSNPPYVPAGDIPRLMPEVRDWDPPRALDGGPDGLAFYRRIFSEAGRLLAPGAELVLEVGDGREGDVLRIGELYGYVARGVRTDLGSTPRAVLLSREV